MRTVFRIGLLWLVLCCVSTAEPYSNKEFHFSVELLPGWEAGPYEGGTPPQIWIRPAGVEKAGITVMHEAMRRDDPVAALAFFREQLGLSQPFPAQFARMKAARATGSTGETWIMVTGKSHSWTIIYKEGPKGLAQVLQSFRELP